MSYFLRAVWWTFFKPSPLIASYIQYWDCARAEVDGRRGCYAGDPELFIPQARAVLDIMTPDEQRFVRARYRLPRVGYTWEVRHR